MDATPATQAYVGLWPNDAEVASLVPLLLSPNLRCGTRAGRHSLRCTVWTRSWGEERARLLRTRPSSTSLRFCARACRHSCCAASGTLAQTFWMPSSRPTSGGRLCTSGRWRLSPRRSALASVTTSSASRRQLRPARALFWLRRTVCRPRTLAVRLTLRPSPNRFRVGAAAEQLLLLEAWPDRPDVPVHSARQCVHNLRAGALRLARRYAP